MRKALIPMLASLLLCGAGTTALVMTSAHAQPAPRPPMMLAQANPAPPVRRAFNRPAPGDIAQRMKDMCQDRIARETGRLAYLETRLQLTAAEQPLFTRWKDATLTVARRHADQCNQRVSQRPAPQSQTSQNQNAPRTRPNPAERMTREEDQLKQRLADIQTERPAMEALYNALSPTQKTELARAGQNDRGRNQGPMSRRSRFADARGAMGGPLRGPGPRGPQGGPPPGPPPER